MDDNGLLLDNMIRRLTDAAVYKKHASMPGISTRAKSGYMRGAIMLAATIVEGMVLYYIRKWTGEMDPVIGSIKEKKVLVRLRPEQVDGADGVFMGREVKKDITLMGRESTFAIMNRYLSSEGLVTTRELKKLEKVRDIRARFHVFIIRGDDTGYTNTQLNFIFDVFGLIMAKVKALP